MNPNTHSVRPSDGVAALTMAVQQLATQDLDGLSDAVRAERVLQLRRLVDRREGHWLNELAAVDADGAAGAEDGRRPRWPWRSRGIGANVVPNLGFGSCVLVGG